MSKTYRCIPPTNKWNRKPEYKYYLLAGYSAKYIVTDWSDKPIAARKEAKYQTVN